MVQAWYMDSETSDQRLEHHKNPPDYITLDELYRKTGVEYFKLNVDTYATDDVLSKLKAQRGYIYEDEVTFKEDQDNFEEKVKTFYTEHLHADEEIRFVLDGSGYFDVRDSSDQWIRIAIITGDMIILPSGIYHRFTLDTNNYIKAKRYFVGDPVCLPHDRPVDDMDCRKEYVHRLHQGFAR